MWQVHSATSFCCKALPTPGMQAVSSCSLRPLRAKHATGNMAAPSLCLWPLCSADDPYQQSSLGTMAVFSGLWEGMHTAFHNPSYHLWDLTRHLQAPYQDPGVRDEDGNGDINLEATTVIEVVIHLGFFWDTALPTPLIFITSQGAYYLLCRTEASPDIKRWTQRSHDSSPFHYKQQVCQKGKFQSPPRRHKLLESPQRTVSQPPKIKVWSWLHWRFTFYLPLIHFSFSILFCLFTVRSEEEYTGEVWGQGSFQAPRRN